MNANVEMYITHIAQRTRKKRGIKVRVFVRNNLETCFA